MGRLPTRTLRPTAGGLFGGSRVPNKGGGPSFGGHRVPVGYGAKGNPFFSLQQYMEHHGGRPPAASPGTFSHGPNPPRLGGGHLPTGGVPGGPQPNATAGGYQGLDQIVQLLQHGINQQQLNNLAAGATGTHNTGIIGGVHGAFSGLSPAAVHWLATSGILSASTPGQTDTTGLTGDALFRAQLLNSLPANQAPTYSLHSGIDANFLTNALKTLGGAYAKGYTATGMASPLTA